MAKRKITKRLENGSQNTGATRRFRLEDINVEIL